MSWEIGLEMNPEQKESLSAYEYVMHKTIFERVRALNFPIDQYVVVGGAMEAHGLRKAHDLDIVVTPKLYEQLKARGWQTCECEQCRKSGRYLLIGDGVDILPDYSYGEQYKADTEKLIAEADIIDELPFVRLDELLRWKMAANREKDRVDIEIIQNYLLQK